MDDQELPRITIEEINAMKAITITASFKHDCDKCIFLGTHEFYMEYDLYLCNEQPTGQTVIARYGNAGYEYLSGMDAAEDFIADGEVDHPLAVALQLAASRGLIEK